MVEDNECAIDEVNISKVSILQYFLVIQSVYLKKTIFNKSVILFIQTRVSEFRMTTLYAYNCLMLSSGELYLSPKERKKLSRSL
uniref:Putative ovule protein n=1 Tax=Solanum chacoense TaxID=4108 RepID=A0A0V0HJ96_SOLCH